MNVHILHRDDTIRSWSGWAADMGADAETRRAAMIVLAEIEADDSRAAHALAHIVDPVGVDLLAEARSIANPPPDMAQISDLWLPINDRPAVLPWVVAAAVVAALIATVGMAANAAAVAQAATMGAW